MKKTLLYFSLFISVLVGFAQSSNSIRVAQIVEPNNNFTYQPHDSSILRVQIVNQGPHDLIAADQLRIRYNLFNASGEGAEFDTLIFVGSPTFPAGTSRNYVIDSSIVFNGADVYSVCADIAGGTVFHPENPEKFPGKCRSFTVNIEKVSLKVDQLYYADGNIHFTLNEQGNYLFEVFNITGKNILSESVQNLKNHQIKLSTSVKGFYFLKATDQNGRSTTSKFVIH